MRTERTISLPRSWKFYQKSRKLKVEFTDWPCLQAFFDEHGDSEVPPDGSVLRPDPAIVEVLRTKRHVASLRDISKAAMQFYQTSAIQGFPDTEFLDALYMKRYMYGHAYGMTNSNSIRLLKDNETQYHSEVLKKINEDFAYGVVVDFIARRMRIPVERIYFIEGSGARADFGLDLRGHSVLLGNRRLAALSIGGTELNIEVKALRGCASFPQGKAGLKLARNLANKAKLCQGAFVGAVVGITQGSRKDCRTTIIIADPGKPKSLDSKAQAGIILRRFVSACNRCGLWISLGHAIERLREFEATFTASEQAFIRQFSQRQTSLKSNSQYELVGHHVGRRFYNGRYFSETIAALGKRGNRLRQKQKVLSLLDSENVGRIWYAGVDKQILSAIETNTLEKLLALSQADVFDFPFDPFGATFFNEVSPGTELYEEMATSVRNLLHLELRRW